MKDPFVILKTNETYLLALPSSWMKLEWQFGGRVLKCNFLWHVLLYVFILTIPKCITNCYFIYIVLRHIWWREICWSWAWKPPGKVPCSQRFQVTTELLDRKIGRNIAFLVIMLKILDKKPRFALDFGENCLEFIENAKKSILFVAFVTMWIFKWLIASNFIVQRLML